MHGTEPADTPLAGKASLYKRRQTGRHGSLAGMHHSCRTFISERHHGYHIVARCSYCMLRQTAQLLCSCFVPERRACTSGVTTVKLATSHQPHVLACAARFSPAPVNVWRPVRLAMRCCSTHSRSKDSAGARSRPGCCGVSLRRTCLPAVHQPASATCPARSHCCTSALHTATKQLLWLTYVACTLCAQRCCARLQRTAHRSSAGL